MPRWVKWTLPAFLWLFRRLRFTGGCFLFSTRAAFEAVGGFDETLYASEELTLCRALQKQGEFVILRESVLTSGRKVRTYSGGELLRDACASPSPAAPACAIARAWTSGTRRAGPTRTSGARPGAAALQRGARRASRKSQATLASARTPTCRLLSSMKKRGEWFGATLQRILALGRDAEEEEQARHHLLEEREVLGAHDLGHDLHLVGAGDALERRQPSPRSAPDR